jgi:hypothetical protein
MPNLPWQIEREFTVLKRAENESAHEKVPISGRVAIVMAQKASILSKLGFTTFIWFR